MKNPRTDSFFWDGTVIAVGGKDFVEAEARNARLQVTEADGNISFVPVIQRDDPDLTVHENISQILLSEDLEPVSSKRLKIVTPSQETEIDQRTDFEDEKENDENPNLYLTLNPDDVNEYVNCSGTAYNGNVVELEVPNQVCDGNQLNVSDQALKGSQENLAKPKHSSTPANRKLKKARTVHPEDLNEMEVRRADLEAANAIKQAAEKINEAAVMIVNCMQELKPEIKSLANRNYREIQMSSNAVKQLVSKNIFLSNFSRFNDLTNSSSTFHY